MAIRISQEPIDVAQQPTNAKARISQASAEVGQLPTTAKARITQLILDVSIGDPHLPPDHFPLVL
jgi:hypothetical protein